MKLPTPREPHNFGWEEAKYRTIYSEDVIVRKVRGFLKLTPAAGCLWGGGGGPAAGGRRRKADKKRPLLRVADATAHRDKRAKNAPPPPASLARQKSILRRHRRRLSFKCLKLPPSPSPSRGAGPISAAPPQAEWSTSFLPLPPASCSGEPPPAGSPHLAALPLTVAASISQSL